MADTAVGRGPDPGWYPDPWGSGGNRWWDGHDWTGEVLLPPPPAPVPLVPAQQRTRPRTGLIVGLVLGGVALLGVVGAVLLVGLNAAVESGETYRQDLVTDQTNFPETSNPGWDVAFASDGLRMTITEPGTYGATGLRTDLPHLAMTVSTTFDPVSVPSGASVGPACLESPAQGYAFLVDAAGTARLVETDIRDSGLWDDGSVRTIATASIDPQLASATELMIACRVPPAGGSAEVSGWIEGVRVVSAEPRMVLSELRYEGMFGHTGAEAPAVWAFTSISRGGVDDMPG